MVVAKLAINILKITQEPSHIAQNLAGKLFLHAKFLQSNNETFPVKISCYIALWYEIENCNFPSQMAETLTLWFILMSPTYQVPFWSALFSNKDILAP